MNVNVKNCGGYHCVPDAVLTQMMADMDCLGGMLGDLIGLYEKESQLKKHHRAYLHVREHADQACKYYKEKMKEIANHWVDQKVTCEDMGCQPSNDPYEKDFVKDSKMEKYQVQDQEFPKGMVLMSSESLGVMQDDVICLTEAVDTMAALFKALIAGCPMQKEDMQSVVNMTSALSEEIMKRWEEAEMIELD